ncbi:beta strand repeat-containing protein [Colwellia psychrerythraea]|uniref:Uncharacterized protein n=1 Tax=Colwellia psychrerythraea TaxID=28229 RepID=A0A099L3J4_COLPS|nr:hypothetical protein [Colwellia psychrerythraea]KGJ97436.1 hypothetical protein GAB14E_1025 [Colwellia psychrerythraea]
MTNHLNTIKQLTVFEPCRSLVSKAVNKALPLVLISPLLLSSELSFAAQLTPNPNDAGNTISIATTDVTNDVAFDNSGTIKVEATGLLTNNASLKNHVGGKLNLNGYANHVEGKHNAFTNAGTLENSGTINLSAYQNFLVNQGTINNEAGGLIHLYNSNAHYNNNLRLDNEAGGVLNNKAGATITLENNGANKYFINDGVVNNDGSISAGDFTHFYNSGQFYNNVGASLIVKQARGDNKVGILTNAGDASLSKWRNSYRFAQTIQNSGTLILEKLTLTRPLTNLSGGTLTTKGNGAASVTFADNSPNSGSLYNSGTWFHNSGQSLKNEALIQNNSDGTINLSGYLNNAATFTNAGTLTLNSGSALYGTGSFDQTTGTTILNSQLAADGGVNFSGGLLTGNGRVILAANTLQIEEQAEVNPGSGVGTLSVTGNVAFNGQLTIELDAKEQGSFDELAVTGDIAFGTASDAVFDFNFTVTEEFTIDFASAGSISNLSNLNYTFIGLSSGYAVVVDESGSKLQLQVRIDTDGDKIADQIDEDDDNDGYTDIDEAANGTSTIDENDIPIDSDGDFISDLTDPDDDNDGVLDDDDAFPFDTDNDGINNDIDLDDDNDGYSDTDEIANGTSVTDANSFPSDNDGDYVSDLIDIDDDNDNLIEISSLADLDEIRNNLSGTALFGSSSGCSSVCNGFELVNDLDFDTSGDGVIDASDSYWNAGLGWSPIGLDYRSPFIAKANGNGFVIKSLMINRPELSNVGLFGTTGVGAEIQNLGLEKVNIAGKYYVGAMTGSSSNTTYNNIFSTGHITGMDSVGGVIGYSNSEDITNLYHVGRVSSPSSEVGGLIGYAEGGNFTNFYNIGPVTGYSDVGGLFGSTEVTGDRINNLTNGYSVGLISGSNTVGGIVGNNYISTLTNVFSLAKISGNAQHAAIAGRISRESELNNVYWLAGSAAKALGRSEITDNTQALSQIQLQCPQSAADVSCATITYQNWNESDSAWDFGNTSQYPSLNMAGSYYRIGDFDNDGVNDLDDQFPSISIAGYPDEDNDGVPDECNAACLASGLMADNDKDFDGITDSLDIDDDNDGLIEISTLAELNEIRNNLTGMALFGSSAGCLYGCEGFELINDLDFDTNADGVIDVNDDYWNGGLGWQPIGSSDFQDRFITTLEGNGFVIRHLMSNRPDQQYVGLIGFTNDGARVLNLGLENVQVTGKHYVGALTGFSSSSEYDNVYSTGSISGGYNIGGVLGFSGGESVSDVYHIGRVQGDGEVGGIIGDSDGGYFSTLYNIGPVLGIEKVGGIIGLNNIKSAQLKDAFSVGKVQGNDAVGGIGGALEETKLTNVYTLASVSGNDSVGAIAGQLTNESEINESYWLQSSAQLGLGFSDITDTSQALTSAQLTCPQSANDLLCSPVIYSNWNRSTTDWYFGSTTQYPVLLIEGNEHGIGDFDSDGVNDLNDLFPTITINDYLDSDHDGAPDNCDVDCLATGLSADTDYDNDGIVNELDTDDDNDGVEDLVDAFPADASESIDTDLDGIGNNADTDDDNDGIIDELDGEPLNAVIGDISPPVFNHSDAIFIKAQGRLTDIAALVEVKALDAVDGEVTSNIVGETLYLSGQHMVELSAEDTVGNIAYYQLELNIKPEVNVISQINVESGGSYALALYLSGEAPHYPVEVLYNIYLNGEVYDEAWVNITAGTQGDIKVTVPANLSVSDTMSISLEFASPAFIGTKNLAKLTLSDRNFAPLMQTHVTQNGEQVSSIDPDNGLVTIQASIEDINQADQHDIIWSVQDNTFDDINNDNQLMTFEVDPSELVDGNYSLDIIVIESNTEPALSVQHTLQLVVEQLAKLALDLDSDNDGINDSEEGYSDSDGDGIADYLDNNSNTTELPSSVSAQPMQTAPGLTMSLGSLVRGVQSQDASLTLESLAVAVGEYAADTQSTDFEAATPLYNFTVGGLSEQGDSVAVVIPLASGTSLPEDAVYRKYNTVDGWYTFVENDKNSVSSAISDINGNCPAANDSRYHVGLTAGDNCIQLIIEDGGANDADFMINGSVEDPGAVMIASVNTDSVITDPINTAPEVSINPHQTTFEEGSDITISVQGIDPEEDVLSYSWSQLSGPTVTFDDVTSTQTTVSLPVVDRNEVIELQVSVFDGELTTVTTTTLTVTNIVETVEETESETNSESSGGSINYLFLCLLLLARYQRLKRVR